MLDGAFYLTRALIEPMVKNKYGRILFFTGEGAFLGGSGRAHVSAAKMGLVGLARGLASEFAPHNIRVNVVSPGSIDTTRANPEWYRGRPPNAAGIPLGRQGNVDEIAATCLFLVSDDGGFITGQTIHVNGGAGVLLIPNGGRRSNGHDAVEDTRLPADIDAQPLVQAAAALRPVLRDVSRRDRARAAPAASRWSSSCTPPASTGW